MHSGFFRIVNNVSNVCRLERVRVLDDDTIISKCAKHLSHHAFFLQYFSANFPNDIPPFLISLEKQLSLRSFKLQYFVLFAVDLINLFIFLIGFKIWLLLFIRYMIILDLYLMRAATIENIKTRKVASSKFNYVFQFIIVCSYHEQRWYWIFFHAIKYRNEFHCGSYLFNVHTNISLMVTNSFLCLQFYRYRLLNKFRCIICTSSFRFLFNFASVSLANCCCATCITIAGLCFPPPSPSSFPSLSSNIAFPSVVPTEERSSSMC